MIKIAQPYCVWWDHKNEAGYVDQWCRENLFHKHQFLAMGKGARLLEINPDDYSGVECEQQSQTMMLAMFECPRDAMLFKLTWVGQ